MRNGTQVTVYLTYQAESKARELGHGNISAGIRVALGVEEPKPLKAQGAQAIKIQGKPSATGWNKIKAKPLRADLLIAMNKTMQQHPQVTEYVAFVVDAKAEIEKVVPIPNKWELLKLFPSTSYVADAVVRWLEANLPQASKYSVLVACKLDKGLVLPFTIKYL